MGNPPGVYGIKHGARGMEKKHMLSPKDMSGKKHIEPATEFYAGRL
jgi:hypothetical protein